MSITHFSDRSSDASQKWVTKKKTCNCAKTGPCLFSPFELEKNKAKRRRERKRKFLSRVKICTPRTSLTSPFVAFGFLSEKFPRSHDPLFVLKKASCLLSLEFPERAPFPILTGHFYSRGRKNRKRNYNNKGFSPSWTVERNVNKWRPFYSLLERWKLGSHSKL